MDLSEVRFLIDGKEHFEREQFLYHEVIVLSHLVLLASELEIMHLGTDIKAVRHHILHGQERRDIMRDEEEAYINEVT